MPGKRSARTAATTLVVVAAVLGGAVPLVVALALEDPPTASRVPVADALPDRPVPPSGAGRPADPPPRHRAALRPARRAATPGRVSIPRLGVEMDVAPYGVDAAGQMALPPTPFTLGWYRFGASPWDRTGATVVAGHVDDARLGAGPLARLFELRPGDRIEVRAGRSRVEYGVVSVRRVAKSVLDTAVLFDRTGPPRLHLVTCGGDYDPETGYEDNVVVLAEPVPS